MEFADPWVAILVATVAGMLIGFTWYQPGVFGTTWGKAVGMDMSKKPEPGEMGRAMLGQFVSFVVLFFVLSHLIQGVTYALGRDMSWMSGLHTAFWTWLGLVVTTQAGLVLWEMKPIRYYFINIGHFLVVMLVGGAIIGHMLA